MKNTPLLTWRVVGWDGRFETRGSLRKRGPRAEIAVSTDLEGDELRLLLDAAGGFMAFALWNLVCRIAATCVRRGVLVHDGVPMTDADLARLARFPVTLISPALQLLASPEIGLLERVPLEQALVPPKVPEPLPRRPRIQLLLQCPVCAADLTEYYQLEIRACESNKSVTKGHSSAGIPLVLRTSASEASGRQSPIDPCGLQVAALPPVQRTSATQFDSTEPKADEGLTDQRGDDPQPPPTWVMPATYSLATKAEIQDVKHRFLCGEMTEAELCHFIATHYYDEEELVDEIEDWEDDAEFQTDIPPPKSREWG